MFLLPTIKKRSNTFYEKFSGKTQLFYNLPFFKLFL